MISFCHSLSLRALAPSIIAILSMTGCSPATTKDSRDPIEGWNRGVQNFNDKLDDYVMKPVATGYSKVTPSVLDQGITNFYNNVEDISVIGNDLLQFKLLQSGQDMGRLFVNSTVGLGGFVDVASKMHLPKHDEDFDQTLAKWGMPSGPYFVIPFIGPSTPRGVFGLAGDTMSNPINWIYPLAVPYSSGTLRLVDQRSDLMSASKIMDEASIDRYEFIRNAYFQQRNYVIHDGHPPLDEDLEKQMDEDLADLDKDKGSSAKPLSAVKTISP